MMTDEEAKSRVDTSPNAFPCPDCGGRMAVFHTHGLDIFHKKPECDRFLARDPAYRIDVLSADTLRREANRSSTPRFIPNA